MPLVKDSSAHNLRLPDTGHNARRSYARSELKRGFYLRILPYLTAAAKAHVRPQGIGLHNSGL
jgi:hypothetical protein